MNEQLKMEEFSLMDILKILWSKIKLLILVLICGGLLGGVFGLVTTYNVNYWGTSMEFYVNPERPEAEEGENVGSGGSTYGVYGAYGRHVMDNIVKLLNSESFAEKLILGGADLPQKDYWVNPNSEQEMALNLNAKIDEAKILIDDARGKQAALDGFVKAKNEASLVLTEATATLNKEWLAPLRNGDVSSAIFNEREYILQQLETKYPSLAAAYQAKLTAEAALDAQNEQVKLAKTSYNEAKKAAEDKTDLTLTAWRKTAKYRALLQKIRNSVVFSYIQEEEELEDAVNLARSFIYVDISVLGDQNREFADDLMQRVQSELPKFVCEKMIIPDGYSGTSCNEITTMSEIDLTNKGFTTTESIKYALLFGAVALVVACVIVIIIDRSDKRVRDYELVARQLNVPLLGIVPSIDDEKIAAWNETRKQGKGE